MEKCIRHKKSVSLFSKHFLLWPTNYLARPARDVEQNRICVFMWTLDYFYPILAQIPTCRQSLASSIKKIVEIYSLFPELFILNIKVATATQSAAFLLTVRNVKTQWRREDASPGILDDIQV
jgi:hypothetical protein